MSLFDVDAALTLADQVLADLAPRGGMYVGRRVGGGDEAALVVQTGEEGRHRLQLPDLSSSRSIAHFVAAAQTHLESVFDRPLPRCMIHEHALGGVVENGQVWWVCPEGEWRCRLGDYEEQNWPPAAHEQAGDVVQALVARFARRGIGGWQTAGSVDRDGRPVIRVSVWPMSGPLIERMRAAADPLFLLVEAGSPPPTREDLQRGIAYVHERDVTRARWAIGCWAEFPVAQRPRPTVFVGSNVRVERGFCSGEAKLGFRYGLINTEVPVPDRVLKILRSRDQTKPPPDRATPVLITAARHANAIFDTDRGPRTLRAWQLAADEVNGPIWVADPASFETWTPDSPLRVPAPPVGSAHPAIKADLGPDQRTLTLQFVGAPSNRMSYSGGQIIESDTALAIIPNATSIGSQARWHTAVGVQQQVTVRLGRPLGDRVLIDLNANPVAVLCRVGP